MRVRAGSKKVSIKESSLLKQSIKALERPGSARKSVEKPFLNPEEKYRLLHDTILQGVVYQDAEGKVLSMNPAAVRILGKSQDEYADHALADVDRPTLRSDGSFLPVSDHPSMVALRTGSEQTNVVMAVYNPREKGYRWLDVRAMPVFRQGDDKPSLVYIIFDDITERKRIEDTQLFLIEQSSAPSDEDFFRAVARHLGETLEMDFVCIDRLLSDRLSAQTVAIYFDGKYEDDIAYALKDTPCGDVVEKKICCFPRDVRKLFPNDAVLQEMTAESYVGVTLWSSLGKPIGLIAVIGRKPLANSALAKSILHLVATRAAAELERRDAEEELKRRAAQLEEVNKELESFSYSVSHDLRAPLRAIDGYARMILKKEGDRFDEETQSRFQVIRNNAARMGQLIDDLLAFSRLGSHTLSLSKLDMETLLRGAFQDAQREVPNRVLALKTGQFPQCKGDLNLIRQVCINILSNAVKFTRVRDLAVIEIGGVIDGGECVYFVKDNGAGFDMTYYPKLFRVFQRLHGEEEYEGTGIGLALVKRIINRHGGRTWAEGQVDAGATFYFSLPIWQE